MSQLTWTYTTGGHSMEDRPYQEVDVVIEFHCTVPPQGPADCRGTDPEFEIDAITYDNPQRTPLAGDDLETIMAAAEASSWVFDKMIEVSEQDGWA